VRSGGAGGSAALEVAEAFLVVADALGDRFEGGAEVGDLGVEAGEGVGVDLVAPVGVKVGLR
jgi:hypothetical protein